MQVKIRPGVFAASLLILLVLVAGAIRLSSQAYPYAHPDEVLVTTIAEEVLARHTFDTNWKRFDLQPDLKYPQYNFSGYHLASAAVLKVARAIPALRATPSKAIFRFASGLLSLVSIVLVFLLGRQLFDARTGLAAALFATVSPLLYQDSLYARPEAFVTALTLASVLIAGSPRLGRVARVAAAAVLLGVLVATKVSMLALAPLLLLPDDPSAEEDRGWSSAAANYVLSGLRGLPVALPLGLAGLALGFWIGAPYAPLNPSDLWFGIVALNDQYSNGFWPHGAAEGDLGDRLAYAYGYFAGVHGAPLLLLGPAGAAVALARRRFRAFCLFILVMAFAVRFALYKTFFERNFSHLLPLFQVFAAYGLWEIVRLFGRWRMLAAAVATAALVLVCADAISITYKLRFRELPGGQARQLLRQRREAEAAMGLTAQKISFTRDYPVLSSAIPDCQPALVELSYPEDVYAMRAIDLLERQDGFREVGRLKTLFRHMPANTLHVYFTPTTLFLYRPDNSAKCRGPNYYPVVASVAGEPFAVLELTSTAGWTRTGAFAEPPDPFGGKDYYGSWSGADALTGKLRMTLAVDGARAIVLPYATGPSPAAQSIVLRDAATGKVLWSKTPVDRTVGWRLLRIDLPSGVRRLVVEAQDGAGSWGEWHAVGAPRTVKAGA